MEIIRLLAVSFNCNNLPLKGAQLMHSRYLSSLNQEQRDELVNKLWDSQSHNCFICGTKIDLVLHKSTLDIDHIEPLKVGGKDSPENFALTHSSCNRSKQASDLRVARVLARFSKIKEKASQENRSPNLDDVLQDSGGAKFPFRFRIEDGYILYSLPEMGNNDIHRLPLYKDTFSDSEYFFVNLPIQYLFHDFRINPRAIGSSLHSLVEEFFKKRPQLHVALAWIDTTVENPTIHIFDGQHKTAAQILLGVKEVPVRVFVNPDPDVLLTTNTNAGTSLRQVAFDKSVQRHLGSSLYKERISRYQKAVGLHEDEFNFTEQDLINFFRGESREIKRYILDDVRDSITHHPDNKLKDYIDFGGKGKEKPLSYSSIEKTFYSFFIYQDILETPLNYKIDEGENPRYLEKFQIVMLMNIIADEIYIGKFDPAIGTNRIENRVQSGEDIADNHLLAYRMGKEEIMYTWLEYIKAVIKRYFLMQNMVINEAAMFQYKFPDALWDIITKSVRNLTLLSLWKNRDLSVFGK